MAPAIATASNTLSCYGYGAWLPVFAWTDVPMILYFRQRTCFEGITFEGITWVFLAEK